MDPVVVAAAKRLRKDLDEADAVGYGKTAWYSYLHRSDIDRIVDHVLENSSEQQLALFDAESV